MYVQWRFDEHNLPTLDYLACRLVVNTVSLICLTLAAELALPGLVGEICGVGLAVNEMCHAECLGRVQVRLVA